MYSENVNIPDLINQFFSDPITRKLIGMYRDESLFDVLNISRQETSHTKFLGWLFNQIDLINTLHFSPLSFFLRKIYKRAEQQGLSKEFDNMLKHQIHASNNSVIILEAFNEYPIENGRLDLFLKINVKKEHKNEIWGIMIENKIDAQLTKDQLSKYRKYFNSGEGKKEADHFIYVFLNADSEWQLRNKPIPNYDPLYIHINYSDLVQDFIYPILNNDIIDERRKTIIMEYIKSLRFPLHKNYKISNMALTQEDKLLLKSFWNNQESLFRSIIEALADASDDEEDRKQFVEMAQTIDAIYSNRDKSDYQINFQGNISKTNKRNLAIEIAKKLLSQNISASTLITTSQDKDVREYNNRPAYISEQEYKNLINEFQSYKDRYVRVHPDLYVSNQWGIKRNGEDPVEILINWAHTYPFIEITKL